jgi:nicotinamidase-related amidase
MSTFTDRTNTALLVVDLQNGVVGEAHDRDAVVGKVATLVEKARASGTRVVLRHRRRINGRL